MMHQSPADDNIKAKHFVSLLPFIILLFYGPIFSDYTPTTSFGHGIPDFNLYRLALFVWFCAFMIDIMNRSIGSDIRSFWYLNMSVYVLLVYISLYWSYEGYTINTIREVTFFYLVPFLIALAAKNYIQQKQIFQKFAKHLIICCVFLSIMSIIQYILNLDIENITAMQVRGAATLGNANLLAIFLVLNLPVLLYLMKKNIISKKFTFIVLSIITLGILSTISRKGIVTMLMTYIIFFALSKNYKLLILLFILFFLGSTVILQQKYFAERFNKEELSSQLEGRFRSIPVGFKLVSESPLIGRGYKGFYHYSIGIFKDKKYDAHNNYVTALVNYGVLGFILFINIFIIPLYRSISTLCRETQLNDNKLKAITSIAIILPFMFSAFFAGGLMYNSLVTSLLYTYFAFFSFADETFYS